MNNKINVSYIYVIVDLMFDVLLNFVSVYLRVQVHRWSKHAAMQCGTHNNKSHVTIDKPRSHCDSFCRSTVPHLKPPSTQQSTGHMAHCIHSVCTNQEVNQLLCSLNNEKNKNIMTNVSHSQKGNRPWQRQQTTIYTSSFILDSACSKVVFNMAAESIFQNKSPRRNSKYWG